MSQNDNVFGVNAVTDNSVTKGIVSNCNHTDVYHNDNDCTLVLKPCKSAGKSIVHYYLQYRAADVGCQLVYAADELNVSSIAGHYVGDVMNIDEVASIKKVNTNITNSLSQDSCLSSKRIRVENIKVDGAEMPDINGMDGVKMMSIMNWVKLGENFLEHRLVYIYPQRNSQLKGFYWAEHHGSDDIWYLSPCLSVPEGNLQVLHFLDVVMDDCLNPSTINDMDVDMYLDYVRDLQCIKTFGYGYTEYMQQLIDQLCQMQDVSPAKEIVFSDISPHGHTEMFSVSETTLQLYNGNTVSDDSYPEVNMHKANVTNTLSDPPEMSLQPINASHCHSPTCSSELLTLT